MLKETTYRHLVSVEGVMRSFAPRVNRDEVNDVEESIGLPLDEFPAASIEGLQEIAPEIEL